VNRPRIAGGYFVLSHAATAVRPAAGSQIIATRLADATLGENAIGEVLYASA